MPDENSTALTWFLYNISEIVDSLTTMFSSVMSVFMEPPLVIFVGLGIFAFLIAAVGKYISGRRK